MRITLVDNILLEQTATGFELDLQPHLGLISLVAVLRAAGHRASLYDPKLAFLQDGIRFGASFYAGVAERLVADDPDIIGFTSLGCNFACTLRIAQCVRAARPELPLILGGPHATIVDREILERYPVFDVIVRHEAEATIGAVVDALAAATPLGGVPGISFRRAGRAQRTADGAPISDLDSLPFAAYDAFPIARLGLTALDVDAGRGCPFGCTFCSTATFFGRRYRLKSPQRLVSELDRLAQTYGIRRFGLTHDLFTVDKRKVRAFCAAVAPRDYAWTCSARIDCVDAELLETMREAGCNGIYFGVETGSQRLQSIVSKNLKLSLYDPIVGKALALGMNTTASFITGFPDERPADVAATLGMIEASIRRYGDELTVQLHLLAPEPGTALHAAHADSLRYDGHVSDFNFPILDPHDAALIASDPAVFMCHFYYARGPARERTIALTDGLRALQSLGHRLLATMIDDYSGSFETLLLDFGSAARGVPDLAAAILAFVRERWPAGHPTRDAVAYLCALSGLRPEPAAALVAPGPTTPMRLARTVAPVDSEHDGAAVVRGLRRGRAGTDAVPAAGPFLLAATRDLAVARMFPIDADLLELVTALRTPTTLERLSARWEPTELDGRIRILALLGAIVDGRGADTPDDCADPDASPAVSVFAHRFRLEQRPA